MMMIEPSTSTHPWMIPRPALRPWVLLLMLLLVAAPCAAQEEEPEEKKAGDRKEWRVTDAHGPVATLSWEVDEGTWISLDVSPDGKEIVLDLLGDLYTLPIEGGEARLLRGGPAYEVQPRFSADGTRIAFTSDHDGADNIWVMNRDGSDAHAVTREDFRLLNNPVWTPDGSSLIARKHFTSRRSLGAGEMWLYSAEGGKGVRLTKRKNDQQDAGEPCISPDGRRLYWSEDVSPGGRFEYNRDPNGVIYAIRCLDLETGRITEVVRGPGGAARPQISPDGRRLAFVRRVRGESVLFLHDLESGRETPLFPGLSKDSQETWSIFGVYPNYSWTPGGGAIVIWARGKIWRVDTDSGNAAEIPFRARIEQQVTEALRFPREIDDIGGERFRVRVVRWPSLSPDRSRAIFQALGSLWLADAGGGSRRRLTDGDRIESAPAFSPDGTRIVYVTWDDVEAGSVEVKELGGGRARTITDRPGHYTEPAFSPDGEWVVYRRGRGDRYRGHAHSSEPGIYRARSSGEGTPLLVTREGRAPRYSAGGERILIESREGEKAALVSVNLLGGDRRVLVTSPHGGEYRISPDGKFLAFTHLFQVYAVPFPRTGGAIEVSPKMRSLPIRKLSEDGGEFIRWSSPTELTFLLGPDLFRVDVAAALAAPEDDTPHPRPARLGFEAEREIPPIDAVFRGARVITMRGDEIIEDGVVRVRGNRIVAVGRRGEVEIPGGCAVIDAAGKVLLPGWVDIHAHTGSSSLDLSPRRKWAFLAALSFGVTTTHDPSNNTRRIFAESEMVKAGLMVGPRVFSTGTILYGAEGDFKAVIDSEEDALRHLRRLRAHGAFSVKSYNQPRRNQRQQVLAAARELGMMVVPEGGSMFHHNMSMILDGHTTIEHAIPVAPLYEDVLHLVSRSGTAYTPTLVVGYGGPFGEQWWYQHSEVWRNRRLLRWVPRSVVDPRSRRRTMIPEEEFHHIDLARAAAEIFRRGGIVEIGAHGQLAGLDVHWEMWMLHQGGLTPHEMLRAATLNGARAIGLDGAIGSIEAGKLADIILLEGDPLEEPRNTTSVSMVMVDGRLHDARTLDRLLPERRPLPPGPDLNTIQVEHFHPCSCGTPGAPGW